MAAVFPAAAFNEFIYSLPVGPGVSFIGHSSQLLAPKLGISTWLLDELKQSTALEIIIIF